MQSIPNAPVFSNYNVHYRFTDRTHSIVLQCCHYAFVSPPCPPPFRIFLRLWHCSYHISKRQGSIEKSSKKKKNCINKTIKKSYPNIIRNSVSKTIFGMKAHIQIILRTTNQRNKLSKTYLFGTQARLPASQPAILTNQDLHYVLIDWLSILTACQSALGYFMPTG